MWNWISKLENLRQAGKPFAIVTVTQCTGSAPRDAGAKMLVLENGKFYGSIGGGHLEDIALKDAVQSIEGGKTRTIRYPLGAKTGQCCAGVVELLFEVVNTGPQLYVFGAGHVGRAVCRTFAGTPFGVHVIDERKEWIESELLPEEVVRHRCEWDDFIEEASWDSERTFVAVMTHRHDVDQAIIEAVIKRPAKYIGLIGSTSKWTRFQQRMTAKGIGDAGLARVHCPLGVDTGGKAPQEVAISLAAEALQVYYGRGAPEREPS
ncbi:MAG: xanthine dehydrogenase accessory protein XdhC [Deltaproteobacteria bacterium]|nr:xanthine dehydrogenase accessory protein XdhC [Deltaproteobacteria bacterium]